MNKLDWIWLINVSLTYISPGLFLGAYQQIHWAFPIYVALAIIWATEGTRFSSQSRKKTWTLLQLASWITTLITLFGGVIGLGLGIITGHWESGMLVGLLYGTLTGAACLLLTGTLTFLINPNVLNNPVALYAARTISTRGITHPKSTNLKSICQTSSTNIQKETTLSITLLFLLALIKGLGLATTLILGGLIGGPIGLAIAAAWGLTLAITLLTTGNALNQHFSKFHTLLILVGVMELGLGLGTLLKM